MFVTVASASAIGAFSQETKATRVASREVNGLVKHALEDLFERQALPDGNLLGNSRRIAVREELPRAEMRIGREALPERAGYEFYLISQSAAQVEANRTKQHIHFVTVDSPVMSADSAKLSVGVDLVVPSEPKLIILCCCTGHGEFREVNGRWRFVKWLGMVCS